MLCVGTEQRQEEMRRARSALIKRIRGLEEEQREREEVEKKRKFLFSYCSFICWMVGCQADFWGWGVVVKLQKAGLPEPIGRGEKARLMKEAKRIEKARAFREVCIFLLQKKRLGLSQ